MADGEQDDRVSREAFERVKRQLDEATQQLEAAKPTLQAVGLIDKAYEHFKAKPEVKDPYAAARAASRDTMFAEVETDQLAETFDSWLSEQQSAFGMTSSDNGDTDSVPTAPPPGAGRPQPSPSGTGGEPKPEPLTWTSPEVRAAKQAGDRNAIRQWVQEGRLQLSPTNPFYNPEG